MDTLISKLIEWGWTGEMALYGIFAILGIMTIFIAVRIIQIIKNGKKTKEFRDNILKGDKVSLYSATQVPINGTVMKAIKGQDTVRVVVEVDRSKVYPIEKK